jgi:hypothetical protein
MEFRPSRRTGLVLNLLTFLILLPAVVYAVFQVSTAPLSVWTVVWVLLPLIGVPLIFMLVYNLIGLLSARYVIDRDGFHLRWGWAYEQIPIKDILSLQTIAAGDETIRPGGWPRWPATATNSIPNDRYGTVDFYLAAGRSARVLIEAQGRVLLISPADPQGFQEAYREASLLGALQPIEAISQRPRFALTRLLSDRVGLVLLALGIILPLILLGYLALRVPDLPLEVPFGFDAEGFPQTFAPPGRLLLMPLISGFCWAANLLFGLWLYRSQANRPLAYALWVTSVVVSGLFWGATLHLLTA